MAKAKKISINTFDKIAREIYKPTETFEWRGIEVTVRRTLSLKDTLEFVNNVVKACFSSEDGSYIPEVKDFAIKTCILEKYSNFSLPTNIEHKYELIYFTDVIEAIYKYINFQQFNEIIASINTKISHLADANIEAVNKQINGLYSAFESLQKQIENIFGGISQDDLTKVINTLGSNSFNEENIVKAYLSNKDGKK